MTAYRGQAITYTVGTVEHIYHLNGTQVVFEESGETVIVYLYDAEGNPIGMQYRAGNADAGVFEEYWFEKNLQGDIVAVYDGAGTKLISYTYDAWGNFTTTYHNGCTVSSHANLNPFRYRGYYYDTELEMYYLQSRYYDPQIGRFINADDITLLGANSDFASLNLFVYCGNNPVSREDDGGGFWNIVIGAAVGALVSAVTTAIDTYTSTGSVDWGKVGISAAVGAVSGGIAATGLGTIAQAAISAGAAAIGSVASDLYDLSKDPNTEGITWKEVGGIATRAVGSAAIGFGSSVFGTAAGKIVSGGIEAKGASMVFKGKIGAGCWTKAQARNMVSQGKALINTARGISSVVGTLFTWPTSTALSLGMS